MPVAANVWAVDLIRDPKKDRRGTLSLGPGHLVFEPTAPDAAALRIPFGSIRRVRRLHGSPVLMLVHESGGETGRVAFYFVQPPPLDQPRVETVRPMPLSFGRTSRRTIRRKNAGYLGISNREKRVEVEEWARAVSEAIRASG